MKNFTVLYPSDSKLDGVISHYYFHENNDSAVSQGFVYYPHYKHAITSYLGNTLTLVEKGSIVTEHATDSHLEVIFSRINDRPIQVEMHGKFKKIGVVLEPLGINHFLDKRNTIENKRVVWFKPEWLDEWKTIVQTAWSLPLDQRSGLLDAFFSSKLKSSIPELFQSTFNQLIHSPEDTTLLSFAKNLNVSDRSLRRLFDKYVGFGFSKMKKIARFRLALKAFHDEQPENLTELALLAQFYDQPEFNRQIKSFSGQKPVSFFNSLSQFDGHTYWTTNDFD